MNKHKLIPLTMAIGLAMPGLALDHPDCRLFAEPSMMIIDFVAIRVE